MSEYNPFALNGKTILVTGASSGIGRTTATECSRLGANLIITGRNAERLHETFDQLAGTGHRQILADITSDCDLGKLVGECPKLNGIALCAGMGRTLPFSLFNKEKLIEVLDLNFNAPFELMRQLIKNGKVADSGSVVFVSSIAGCVGGTAAGNTVYAASKAAMDAVMRHLVREFSSRKIRFNSVAPGMVNTPLAQKVLNNLTMEQRIADLTRYPLGRLGEPIDIAHGIIYLLSDAASWTTGQRLVIDGGFTV